MIFKLFLCGLLLLLPAVSSAVDPADVSDGATKGFVDVSSTTAGVRIGPDAIRTALRVRVKAGGASVVCFNYVDRGASCATELTSADHTGYCADVGAGAYVFLVMDEHWRGQVCAINASAGTSRVGWNAW